MAEHQKSAGFTLIEILVVLSIIAILAVTSIANLIANVPRYRLRQAVTHILSTLQSARLRAIKENNYAVINFDPDGNGHPDGNYIAFVDNGSSGMQGDWIWQPESGEPLITRGQLPKDVRITRTTFPKHRLRFNNQGHLMGINRNIYLNNSDDVKKKITVYASGNSRVN
jgi:prepilin-type N-terminal cleavage/methylation domain-containing protein